MTIKNALVWSINLGSSKSMILITRAPGGSLAERRVKKARSLSPQKSEWKNRLFLLILEFPPEKCLDRLSLAQAGGNAASWGKMTGF